ncbi:hypothetical protein ND910_03900 [Schaalia meyeri]|uniref:hypothetical protein n=1 Tax=Schaalia meyeri TaxID=52773 RepID=UPI00204329EB|nr:hypothetical protein [Schaalia meyeri]MCM3898857.1 hypothetical protein [Schaalia meyeri]
MEARFSQCFPAVTGDLGSIWSCQNEIRNRKRVFVQDILEYGDATKVPIGDPAEERRKPDLGSIFEKAFVQSHMGGTRGKFPTWGASGRLSALTMTDVSGKATYPTVNLGINRESLKTAAIDAVTTGRPVVAESSPFAGDAQVTANGSREDITIASSHVYTVAAADENGVTLINPWGQTIAVVTVAAERERPSR